ncbi:hypothetical protein FOL46_006935 [Perkinsus olseni]|uniref:GAF domain-containing protein n=1 Tax=Perkinsus olseni TaxID=32597 RepID=A0A7J6LGW4_PEROL|nr:hypothetical protein FOL46_006935 [Perkinsus olseni]
MMRSSRSEPGAPQTDGTTAGDDLFDSVHNTSLESYGSVVESRAPSGSGTDRHDLMRAVQALRYDNKELRGRLKKIIRDVEGRFKSISLDGASLASDEDLVLPDAYFYEHLVSRLHDRCDDYRNVLQSKVTAALDLLSENLADIPGLTFNTLDGVRKILTGLEARVKSQQEQEKALVRTTRTLHTTVRNLSKKESISSRLEGEVNRLEAEVYSLKREGQQMKRTLFERSQQLLHARSRLQELERVLSSVEGSKRALRTHAAIDSPVEGPAPDDLGEAPGAVEESRLPKLVKASSRAGSDMAMRNAHLVKQVKLLSRLQEQSRKLRFSEKQRMLFQARNRAAEAQRKDAIKEANDKSSGTTSATHRSDFCFETYKPLCVQNAPDCVVDFLTYIIATHGYFPNVFLQESVLSDEDRDTCIEVLCRDFSLFYQRSNALGGLLEDIDEISRIRDSNEALSAISRLCVKYVNCDRVAIWVIDERTQTAWTKHTGHAPDEDDDPASSKSRAEGPLLQIPLTGGLVGAAYKAQTALNIADAYTDPRFNSSVDKATGYRTRSVLCMPIMRGPECVAVLQVVNKISPTHSLVTVADTPSSRDQWATVKFDTHDEFLLQIIGGVTVQALEQCLADEMGRMKLVRKDILLDAAFQILSDQSCKTLRDLMQLLSAYMTKLFHAGKCSLAICEIDGIQVVNMKKPPSATTPTDPSSYCTRVRSKAQGLVGEAIESRGLVITSNAASSSKYDIEVDVQVDGSAGETVYTWPSIRLRRVTTVLQWTCAVGSGDPLKMGDNTLSEGAGTFQSDNPDHMEVIEKLVEMIEKRVEEWWPASERMKPRAVNLQVIRFSAIMKKAIAKDKRK